MQPTAILPLKFLWKHLKIGCIWVLIIFADGKTEHPFCILIKWISIKHTCYFQFIFFTQLHNYFQKHLGKLCASMSDQDFHLCCCAIFLKFCHILLLQSRHKNTENTVNSMMDKLNDLIDCKGHKAAIIMMNTSDIYHVKLLNDTE